MVLCFYEYKELRIFVEEYLELVQAYSGKPELYFFNLFYFYWLLIEGR